MFMEAKSTEKEQMSCFIKKERNIDFKELQNYKIEDDFQKKNLSQLAKRWFLNSQQKRKKLVEKGREERSLRTSMDSLYTSQAKLTLYLIIDKSE